MVLMRGVGVEVSQGGPFDAAAAAHPDGEAFVGDEVVIEAADQAHGVDVGGSAVLPFDQVVDLAPLRRNVAAGAGAALISRIEGQALGGGGEAG